MRICVSCMISATARRAFLIRSQRSLGTHLFSSVNDSVENTDFDLGLRLPYARFSAFKHSLFSAASVWSRINTWSTNIENRCKCITQQLISATSLGSTQQLQSQQTRTQLLQLRLSLLKAIGEYYSRTSGDFEITKIMLNRKRITWRTKSGLWDRGRIPATKSDSWGHTTGLPRLSE